MKHFYILVISLWLVNGAMAQWVPQNSGTTNHLNSVYFTGADTGYIVGSSGTIIKTTNGGADWIIQNSETSNSLNSVFFTDSNTGYAAGDSGKILKTINGGTLWTSQSTGILNKINSIYFVNADTGYAVSGENDTSGFILKTTSGGNLWSINYIYEDSLSGITRLRSVHFPNTTTGYAVGYNFYGMFGTGFILKTINGGTDWTIQNMDGLLSSVYFINPDSGYIAGTKSPIDNKSLPGIIKKTTNGGVNWINLNLPGVWGVGEIASVYFTDANTGYTVGALILKTINEGTDWTIQTSGTSSALNSVYFPESDTGYIVGDYGTILKTTNGGGYVGVNNQPSNSKFFKIYPNPSSGRITLETTEEGYLSIENLKGQEFLKQTVTKLTTQIDITDLPVGVYFIKFRDETIVHVGKVIKE